MENPFGGKQRTGKNQPRSNRANSREETGKKSQASSSATSSRGSHPANSSRPTGIPCVSDAPNAKSPLFEEHASAVAKVIEASSLDHGFTVGVFGPWGSGKTSFLELIKDKISEDTEKTVSARSVDSAGIRNICVEFDAWRYDNAAQVTAALYNTVQQEITNQNEIAPDQHKISHEHMSWIKKYFNAETLLNATSFGLSVAQVAFPILAIPNIGLKAYIDSAVPGDWADAFDRSGSFFSSLAKSRKNDVEKKDGSSSTESPQAEDKSASLNSDESENISYAERLKGLSKILCGTGNRVVVFVDDLDRCAPDTVASLIQGIGSCLDISSIVFVLALDRDYLVNVINQKYAAGNGASERGGSSLASYEAYQETYGERFLEKIIQFPVYVPSIQFSRSSKVSEKDSQFATVVGSELKKSLEEYGVIGDVEYEITHYIIPRALRSNPRQVKRLLASFFYGSYVNWPLIHRGAVKTESLPDSEKGPDNYSFEVKYLYMLGLKQGYYGLYEAIRNELFAAVQRLGEKEFENQYGTLRDFNCVGDIMDSNVIDSGQTADRGHVRGESKVSSSPDIFLLNYLDRICKVVAPKDFRAMDDLVSTEGQAENALDVDDSDSVDTLRRNYVKNLLDQLDPSSELKAAVDTLSEMLLNKGLTARLNDTSISFESDSDDVAQHDNGSRRAGAPQRVIVSLVFTSKTAKRIYLFVAPRSKQGKEMLESLGGKGAESRSGYFRNMKGLGHAGSGDLRIAVPVSQAAALPSEISEILDAEINPEGEADNGD